MATQAIYNFHPSASFKAPPEVREWLVRLTVDKCIQQTYNTSIMIRTQIYIPDELHQAAKTVAKRKAKSLAEVLRKFIAKGVEEERKQLKPKSLSSLAKLNITEGPKDLSRNMDKYLYQK